MTLMHPGSDLRSPVAALKLIFRVARLPETRYSTGASSNTGRAARSPVDRGPSPGEQEAWIPGDEGLRETASGPFRQPEGRSAGCGGEAAIQRWSGLLPTKQLAHVRFLPSPLISLADCVRGLCTFGREIRRIRLPGPSPAILVYRAGCQFARGEPRPGPRPLGWTSSGLRGP